MLIQIDGSKQSLNPERIESILIAPENVQYKVRMFSGETIFVSKEIVEEIING